jgi:probable selenium-dependent hydroxylase accessory protein YqeC
VEAAPDRNRRGPRRGIAGMTARIGGFDELCACAAETDGRTPVIALVGAGGKTGTMFRLARSFAADGARVLVTTTTHILSPDAGSEREGRGFGPLLVLPDPASPAALAAVGAAGPRVVLAAAVDGRRLTGIRPDAVPALAALFDFILIEADGARLRPIKAPAPHEPVVPPASSAVIGVIGLDALGAPMDERTVFRPGLFGPLTGCAPGEAITARHILRLVSSPAGLFKSAPPSARRILLLNKGDAVPAGPAEECARAVIRAGACDAVCIGAIGGKERQ